MEQNTTVMVTVTNRNAGWTGYSIPDTGVTRNFSPKESKKIALEELKQLQYVNGGDYLLEHCLMINDESALKALAMDNVEPEYFYTEADVRRLLETGSLDELEDCLNFAPEGVIELVKSIAVETELPDMNKRKLITEKTGFNINNAININTVMAVDEQPKEEEVKERKAATPIVKKASTTTTSTSTIPVRKATSTN